MKKASVYLSSLLCPLLCTAMELPTQELSSSQPNRQAVLPIDNAQDGKGKYEEARINWDVDPARALDLLLQAKTLGDSQAHKKLEEIRQSKAYKEPKNAKSTQDIGVLLRKMEPTAKELYLAGMGDYTKNPSEALQNFLKAEAMGSKQAKDKLKDIRKSKDYTSYNKGTITASIGALLKAVELQGTGNKIDSKLKVLADLKDAAQEPKIVKGATVPLSHLIYVKKQIGQGLALLNKGEYSEARKCFNTLCIDKEISAVDKAQAQLYLAEMDMNGDGIEQTNFQAARQRFQDVCSNKGAAAEDRARAQLFIAKMNIHGDGLDQPDYKAARQGFQEVYTNNKASAEDRAYAQLYLAQMDMRGDGNDNPNYKAARQSFQEICSNGMTSPEDRAQAQLLLAEMNLLGYGLSQPNYKAACQGFQAVYTNKDAAAEDRAQAQLFLAEMDLLSNGIPQPNYKAARQGFQEVYTNKDAAAEDRAQAQLRLAEMNVCGNGIAQPNYTAAHQSLQEVYTNNDAAEQDRAHAHYLIAAMNVLGQGIKNPNYQAARQGFEEIRNSNDASAVDKENAQRYLADMDDLGLGLAQSKNPKKEIMLVFSTRSTNKDRFSLRSNMETNLLENKALKEKNPLTRKVSSSDVSTESFTQEVNDIDGKGEIAANHQHEKELISQKYSKKSKTILLPAKPKKEELIVPSTRSTGKERRSLQRRNTETNLQVDTEQKEKPLLTRRVSSSDLKTEKKKKSEGYLSTQTNLKRTLQKKKSLSNLKGIAQDDDSECSFSESSAGFSEQQEGRRDNNLRKVKALLNDSDLVHPAGIKLTASIVRRALRELGADGQNKISWNFEKDNNSKHDKIIAQQLGNQHNSLCIHLHGPWYENKDVINHFLNFIRQCDGEVDALMKAIETQKSKKRNSLKYGKLSLK